MVNEIRYTSTNRILDELMRHPMLQDLTLEQVVSYTLQFIGLNGLPKMYQDRIEDVEIEDFRGLLPCDLISIIQVKDAMSGKCLRSMTDNFPEGMRDHKFKDCVDPMNNMRHMPYIPPRIEHFEEPSFKTQGRVIFTSFPKGVVEVAYKAIPVDENGFPMLINNEVFMAALRAYIKQEVFTIKFDMGNLPAQALQNAQSEYCFRAAQLNSEMMIPSVNEMQSIAAAFNTMIPKMREFSSGFKHTGSREYLKRH